MLTTIQLHRSIVIGVSDLAEKMQLGTVELRSSDRPCSLLTEVFSK
jgi:hypothetical protein